MSRIDDLNGLAKTIPDDRRERFWSIAASALCPLADQNEFEIVMSILRSERDQLAATDAAESFTLERRAICLGL